MHSTSREGLQRKAQNREQCRQTGNKETHLARANGSESGDE